MSTTTPLFQEALIEARKLREAATAEAKAAVLEAVAPVIKQMIDKEISGIIQETVRLVDICGRFGGEEFIALLPDTDIDNALILGERIRKKVEMHEFKDENHSIHKTISIGISSVPDDLIKDEFQMVEWSDKALYYAKNSGRNKVILYSELDEFKEFKAR